MTISAQIPHGYILTARGRSVVCLLPLWMLLGAKVVLQHGASANNCTMTQNTTEPMFETSLLCTMSTRNTSNTATNLTYACVSISSVTTAAPTTAPTTAPRNTTSTHTDSTIKSIDEPAVATSVPNYSSTEDIVKRLDRHESKAKLLLEELTNETDPQKKMKVATALRNTMASMTDDVLGSDNVEEGLSSETKLKIATKIFNFFENSGPQLAASLGLGIVSKHDSETLEMINTNVDLTSSEDVELNFNADNCAISKEGLLKLSNESTSLGLSATVFKTAAQYLDAKKTGDRLREDKNQPQSDSFYFGTNVVLVALNTDLKKLPLPVNITFSLNRLWAYDTVVPSCLSMRPEDEVMTSQGCRSVKIDSSHIKCACSHLTSFAILMTVVEEADEPSLWLDVLSYICITVGLIFLLLAFLTFAFFRNLRSDRNTIHTHLCVSLGLGQLLFLIGADQTSHKVACAVLAGFLHYLFLAAFFWMIVEGLHIYIKLVLIFELPFSLMPVFLMIGYGIPLIIVIVSAVVYPGGYGTDNVCWLKKDKGFHWSFIGPVLVVIAFNLVMLSIAIAKMIQHHQSPTKENMSNMAKMRAWLKGALALVFLMGITWLFGLLNTGDTGTEVFAALFVILSGGQGVFIYAFHCCCNEKVRKEYRRILRRADWLPGCIRLCCFKLFASNSAHDMTQTSTTPNKKATTMTEPDATTTVKAAAPFPTDMKRNSGFRSSIVEISSVTATQLADAGVYLGGDFGQVSGMETSLGDVHCETVPQGADVDTRESSGASVDQMTELRVVAADDDEGDESTPKQDTPTGDPLSSSFIEPSAKTSTLLEALTTHQCTIDDENCRNQH